MFLGVICTILFIVVCLRGLEKRRGKRAIFTKLHTPASILLVIVTVAHIAATWQYLDARPFSIFATGFLAGFLILLATVNGYLIGNMGSAKMQARLHRAVALLACISIILHVAAIVVGVTAYQARVQNIEITNIDATHIPDGVYIGKYDVTYVAVRLAVTVESGRISDIEILEHRGGAQGIPAEAIIHTITEQQNIDVDTITGATNSSRVIQAAIINALQQ